MAGALTTDQKRDYIVSRARLLDVSLGTAIFQQVQATYADVPGVFIKVAGQPVSIELGRLEAGMVDRIWRMVTRHEANLRNVAPPP